MATRPAVPIDPDAGIPDLIRRLVDDSRRLAQDEVRLAKLEMRERAHDATRGGIWLGIAAGAGVIALIALTVCLAALIGRLLDFRYWAGTLIVAVFELGIGALFVTRGLATLKRLSLTLPETRHEVAKTADVLKSASEQAQAMEEAHDRERRLASASARPADRHAAPRSLGDGQHPGLPPTTRREVEIPIERRD